jgi:hypothetical protein
MTIEAESRKAESATLTSQINKLEGTVRVITKLDLYESYLISIFFSIQVDERKL